METAIYLKQTGKFSVWERNELSAAKLLAYVDLNCGYTRRIVTQLLNKRKDLVRVTSVLPDTVGLANCDVVQICDFENIIWEPVLAGQHRASSYIVRKGLSRKAQISLQLKRFCSKNPKSILKAAVPLTLIVETWNAFDNMKVDFGFGMVTSFDMTSSIQMPLRQRLQFCLEDINEELSREDRADWTWILKPSVTNKGLDISIVDDWEQLLDRLEDLQDVREWVLQRYVPNPLLIGGHKFHLRVYVLCVGTLRVFVCDKILMLLAGRKYDINNKDDIYRHLTNTARAAEIPDFREEDFVKLLDDLPEILVEERPEAVPDIAAGKRIVSDLLDQVHSITNQIFSAFENEYTVFSPMANCFELYGFDFLVTDDFKVIFLEANPGPDFQQTGSRLQTVIETLWDETLSLVVDGPSAAPLRDLSLVYDKVWSASQLQGSLKLA